MPDLHSVVVPQATTALQALSTVTILRVPHGAIRAIAARYPAIAAALWRECVLDAAILSQWIVNVGRRDARTRMAHLLCEMAIRMKADVMSERISFELDLTQSHLADATGLTPVHVNRTLMALRAAGLATLSQRRLTIMDWRGLVAEGEFDARYLHAGARPEQRLQMAEAG